jgi:hypothetical protein
MWWVQSRLRFRFRRCRAEKPCDARGRSRERDAVAKTMIRASVQRLGVKRAGHICACDRAALMRFRFWVCRPDKAAFKNMLQHLRRIIAGFDLLIMENFYFNRVGELHAMSR